MRTRSTLELCIYGLIIGAFIVVLSMLHHAGLHVFGKTNGLWMIAGLLLLGAVIVLCSTILGRTYRWLVAIVLYALAVGSILIAIYGAGMSYHLANEGISTQARAIKRVNHVTNHYTDFIYTGKTSAYTLDYVYTANGRSYTSRNVYVTKETWDKAETDQILPIRYYPTTPGTNMIDLPQEQQGQYLLALGAFLLGSLLWWSGNRRWIRASEQQVTHTALRGQNFRRRPR